MPAPPRSSARPTLAELGVTLRPSAAAGLGAEAAVTDLRDVLLAEVRSEHDRMKECLGVWQRQLSDQLQCNRVAIEEVIMRHRELSASEADRWQESATESLQLVLDRRLEALPQQLRPLLAPPPKQPQQCFSKLDGIEIGASLEALVARLHTDHEKRLCVLQQQHAERLEEILRQHSGACQQSGAPLETASEKQRASLANWLVNEPPPTGANADKDPCGDQRQVLPDDSAFQSAPSDLPPPDEAEVPIGITEAKDRDFVQEAPHTSEDVATPECVQGLRPDAQWLVGLDHKRVDSGTAGGRASTWRNRAKTPLAVASMVLVALNCIYIGAEAEIRMRAVETESPVPSFLNYIDIIFAVLFSFELGFRILVEGRDFFTGPMWRWNAFDGFLLLTPLLDVIVSFFNLSFLRSLRIFRAVRAARIIRSVKYVRELRLMVASILCSLVSLVWAFFLLVFVLYMFAIAIMQTAEVYLSADSSLIHPRVFTLYGTVPLSMTSLFMAITGGDDWVNLVAPLKRIGGMYTVLFIFYVTFVVFGVMNILTAIFVESAKKIAAIDRDLVMQDHMLSEKATINTIRKILMEADTDDSGTLTREELDKQLSGKETIAHLQSLQIDVSEARGLFQLLDPDESNLVSIDDFVCGMMRLKGAAKGVDVATVMCENKRIFLRLSALMKFVEDRFDRMQPKLHGSDAIRASRMREYLYAETVSSRRTGAALQIKLAEY